ncbi:unnamed protein product [Victoria cruziana]
MTKASTLPYVSGRRNNSFRTAVMEGAGDGASKSSAALFCLLLYGLCCVVSLVLGFRFSRLIFYLLFSVTSTTSRLSTATSPPNAGNVRIDPLLDVRTNRLPAFSSPVVREQRLDGIVMFCDDSNVHSLELFDEVQSVKWMGALSVDILSHPGQLEGENTINGDKRRNVGVPDEEEESNLPLPVQGPSCNSSGRLVGWHIFNGGATALPRKLEWAGFVMNSMLVWKIGDEEEDGRPKWTKDLDEISENGDELQSPLSLLKDVSFVEPLGKCGRKVMLWWLRVEARADSNFPPGIGDPPEVTVPAKWSSLPDTPPLVVTASTERKGIVGDEASESKTFLPC